MAIIMKSAMSDGVQPFVPRCLDLERLLARRSVLLLGPRQTGKSTYVRRQLADTVALSFSLLDQGLLTAVLADPTRIRREIAARDLRGTVVCIDEIQKCPALMDEVHLMIEERGIRFLLTGSSARSLRRKGVNLLGGRGSDRVMRPFSWCELRDRFSLDRALNHGLLPPHYLDDEPDEGLASYVDRYLTEEIAAEGLARNLPRFARFLQTAATTNAQMLNYSNVARDAQLPRQTVVQWYEVLRDTLLASELPAWPRTVKRKAIETAKFYFFDTGVVRALQATTAGQPGVNRLRRVLRALRPCWSSAPGSTIGGRARLSPTGAPVPDTRSTSSSTIGSRSKPSPTRHAHGKHLRTLRALGEEQPPLPPHPRLPRGSPPAGGRHRDLAARALPGHPVER